MAKNQTKKPDKKRSEEEQELEEEEEQISKEIEREQTLDNILEFVEPEIQSSEAIDLSLSSGQTQQTPSSLQQISETEKTGLGEEEARETEEEEEEKPGTVYEQAEAKYDTESPRISIDNKRVETDRVQMPNNQVNATARTARMIDPFAGMGGGGNRGGDYEVIETERADNQQKMPWEQKKGTAAETVKYKPRA